MMDNMKKANVFLVKHIKGEHIENFMAATHDRYMLILKSMDDEILNLKKSFENPNFSQLKKTFTKYSKRFWRKITNSS